MTAIRSRVSSIYNANQITDSWDHTSTLSNSLWIDDTYSVKNEVLRPLAVQYKTSAYRGDAVKIILPNADTSVDLLLNDAEVLDLIVSDLCGDPRIDYEKTAVNLSMPKFMLFCNADLAGPLASMGITDIFNDQTADFSPITNPIISGEAPFSLSQLLHVNRVLINPNGCVDRPEDQDPFTEPEFTKGEGIDFVIDRPFLFVVSGPDGMPLLSGVIHEPEYFHRISVS